MNARAVAEATAELQVRSTWQTEVAKPLRSNPKSKTQFCESARLRGVWFTPLPPRRPSSSNKIKVFYMREWRNWQTRTFEGRVVYTVRVQVPFLAPEKSRWIFPSALFCFERTVSLESVAKPQACAKVLSPVLHDQMDFSIGSFLLREDDLT